MTRRVSYKPHNARRACSRIKTIRTRVHPSLEKKQENISYRRQSYSSPSPSPSLKAELGHEWFFAILWATANVERRKANTMSNTGMSTEKGIECTVACRIHVRQSSYMSRCCACNRFGFVPEFLIDDILRKYGPGGVIPSVRGGRFKKRTWNLVCSFWICVHRL